VDVDGGSCSVGAERRIGPKFMVQVVFLVPAYATDEYSLMRKLARKAQIRLIVHQVYTRIN
jgi:hypothetical protein